MNELTNKLTKRLELIKPLTTKPPYYTYEKKILEAILNLKRRALVDGLYPEWKEALEKTGFTVTYKEIGKNGFLDVTISW